VRLSLEPLSTKWVKIPKKIEADFQDAVYNQTVTNNRLHKAMWQQHYDRLIKHAQAGWGRNFAEARSVEEWQRFQAIEANLRSFAAHKQHRIIEELRGLMTIKDITRDEYDRRAALIINRHNRAWLRTELQAATVSAQAAESWSEIERRAYLYPNLRYATAHDERVRAHHKTLDNIVRPVNDPFWNTYYPPNGWGCRCKVVQTDDPVTGDPAPDFKPPKGFDHNPGKTGKVFSDTHPYFNIGTLDQKAIEEQAKAFHAAYCRERVRDWAAGNLTAGKWTEQFPGMPHAATITQGEVKTITGKPHNDAPARNNLLYIIALITDRLRFVGTAEDHKPKHKDVVKWYYYLIELGELKFYLNFWHRRDQDGERIGLHAINDVIPKKGP
jgi:SPP1 gp7 family putative phage head morphogenesis protein